MKMLGKIALLCGALLGLATTSTNAQTLVPSLGAPFGSAYNNATNTAYLISEEVPDFPSTNLTVAFHTRFAGNRGNTPITYAVANQPNEFRVNYQPIGTPTPVIALLNITIKGQNYALTVSPGSNTWRHIAVTWNSSTGQVLVYQNGALLNGNVISPGVPIQPGGIMVLGQNQKALGGDFDPGIALIGDIDDLAIYNRVLTAGEITQLATTPFTTASLSGLTHGYTFSAFENLGVLDRCPDDIRNVAGPNGILDQNEFCPLPDPRTAFPEVVNHEPPPPFSIPTGFSQKATSIGDFDGDGFDDLAMLNPDAGTNGALYVMYGSGVPSKDTFQQRIDSGRGTRMLGGTGITLNTNAIIEPAGDFNGDGLADFLVGAPDSNVSLLVYGSSSLRGENNFDLTTLDGTNGVRLTADGLPNGRVLGGLGDVNGDGTSDILVNYGTSIESTSAQLINNSTRREDWTVVEPGGSSSFVEFLSNRIGLVIAEPETRPISFSQRIPWNPPQDRIVYQIAALVDRQAASGSSGQVEATFQLLAENSQGDQTSLGIANVVTSSGGRIPYGVFPSTRLPEDTVALVYKIQGRGISGSGGNDIYFDNFRLSYSYYEASTSLGTAAVIFGSTTGLGSRGEFNLRSIGSNADGGRRGTAIHHGGLYFTQSGPAPGIGDFDGDGFDDILLSGVPSIAAGAGTIVYGARRDPATSVGIGRNGVLSTGGMTQNIDGTIVRFGTYLEGTISQTMTARGAGDIDGDGRGDILAAFTGNTSLFTIFSRNDRPLAITALPQNTTVRVTSLTGFATSAPPRSVGDIDGDGRSDAGITVRLGTTLEPATSAVIPSTTLLRTDDPLFNPTINGVFGGTGGTPGTAIINPAGDFNRDGLHDFVINASPVLQLVPSTSVISGYAAVDYGRQSSPGAPVVVRNWLRHGDGGNPSGALPLYLNVPLKGVGTIGTHPDLVPTSHLAIGFRGGDTAPDTQAPSEQTVTLFRQRPPIAFRYERDGQQVEFKSARKYWRLQTNRINFSESTIRFFYNDGDMADLTQEEIARIGVFYSPVDPAAPGFNPNNWQPLQAAGFNPDRRYITVRREFDVSETDLNKVRRELEGYYALFSGDVVYELGEEIIPSVAVDVDKLPAAGPLVEPIGATFWHQGTRKLYAAQPFAAVTIRWIDQANPGNPPMETTVASLVWPGDPTGPVEGPNSGIFDRYIVSSPPVPLDARDSSGTQIQSVLVLMTETDADKSQVEANKTFYSDASGRSFLLLSTGTNPFVDPIYFQFVWSTPFNTPGIFFPAEVTVGTDIGKWGAETDNLHDLEAGEPYFYNELGFYNANLYDRSAAPQTGPLIPVNTLLADSTQDEAFLAVLYEAARRIRNPLDPAELLDFKVFWPAWPIEFDVRWPTVAETPDPIVIASQVGSGPLVPTTYKTPSIYYQNTRRLPGEDEVFGTFDDITLLGYNPNEEHALLIDQGNGQSAFALRDDLATPDTSEPFVLVEYLDAQNGDRPAMRVFRVVKTDALNDFFYDAPAAQVGNRVEPPFPLRSALFPTCAPSQPGALDGNYTTTSEFIFQDRTGAFWVISADGTATVNMRYFYGLREGFYMPEDYKAALRATDIFADDEEFLTGRCIPWLDEWQNPATAGTPIDISFTVEWPADAPVLFAAETLVRPKRGLPGIDGADSVEIAYDQARSLGGGKSVDLIDPTRDRFVPFQFAELGEKNTFLADVKTVRINNVLEFEELVPHIRSRLLWDDNANRLIFRGEFVRFIAGEDMLLPNVMTSRERDQILALSADPVFVAAVEALYEASREIKLTQPTSFVARTIASDSFSTPTAAMPADVDGDGDLDFYVLTNGNQTVFRNRSETGDGWERIPLAGLNIPGNVTHLAPGDFDRDGDQDLVVATDDGGRNLFLMVSPGDPRAAWTRLRITGSHIPDITSVSVADIDNDGDSDVLVSSLDGIFWFQFQGTTQETWERYEIREAVPVLAAHAASFDGQLFPEIVYGRQDTGDVYLLRNNSTVTAFASNWNESEVAIGEALEPSAFATGDFDGDGLLDIATASRGNGRVLLHRSINTNPLTVGPFETSRIADGFDGVDSIAVQDVDNDGDLDVVASSSNSGRIQWFESNGPAPTNYYVNFISSVFPDVKSLVLADIDLDGNVDVIPTVFDGSGTGIDTLSGVAWFESDGSARDVFDSLALTAAVAQGEGFVTLVFNNADFSTGAVTVEVIRVSCPLYRGEVKIIYPQCPFNERVALRHSGDFAGQADNYEFRWRYAPAPIYLQILADTGAPPPGDDLQVWTDFPNGGAGAVDIAVQDPSGELILSDLFWIVSYRPYAPNIDPAAPPVCPPAEWSEWTRGGLTEGWVKRVIGDFGPFRQRATGGGIQGAENNFIDYTNRTVNTMVSMISQAGERWEGNVPLSCGSVDELGLIETYQSVLNRAKALSIFAAPRRDLDQFIEIFDDEGNLVTRIAGKDGVPDAGASAGVSNALLLAAARIADLYTLIGNEAFADASDPTIAFGTDDGVFGPVATSIHPFMNQTANLLEEELKLLRGRDSSSLPSIQVRPFYNRLIWNFTNDFAGGEVAYVLNYGIADVNVDSVIDEVDASILYPQGHGDAWGHQLTALKAYYDLIREPEFAWVPRTEPVLVGGQPVEVDYYDERKFATLAANLARTGREVVNLAYRDAYSENPNEQFQGYKDSDPDRAWGVAEWGSRAGMGAYFNWVTANALLPADDGSVEPTSIRKIDRGAVGELKEIAAAAIEIQRALDDSDAGLNPLGLSTNSIPFDISPAQLASATNPKTHFEQVYDRALTALGNAKSTFDFASAATLALRRQADQVSDFQTAVEDQEIDYNNRLIEVFGTPYPDDIGPGKTYPQGYQGPDLIHWAYFDPGQLVEQEIIEFEIREVTGYIRKDLNYVEVIDNVNFDFTDSSLDAVEPAYGDDKDIVETIGEIVEITYHISERYGQTKPAEWTADRRVYGSIQQAQLELFQSITRFRKAVDNYDGFIIELETKLDLLELKFNVKRSQLQVKRTAQANAIAMDVLIFSAKVAAKAFGQAKESSLEFGQVAKDGVPDVIGFSNDLGAPVQAVISLSSTVTSTVLEVLEIAAELTGEGLDVVKEQVDRQSELAVETFSAIEEVKVAVAEIQTHLLNDSTLRFEMLLAEQEIQQKAAAWTRALAEGQRLLEERSRFRRKAAGRTQEYRYKDMAFRIFRNEAVQKYRAALDLAARYVYLTAKAYDYETNLLQSDGRGPGQDFLTSVVKARTLGLIDANGLPQTGQINGDPGLADPMARMFQNWEFALKGQLGFNNPQTETNRFSLRRELFRIGLTEDAEIYPGLGDTDAKWREVLSREYGPNASGIVRNLFALPEFRRYAIPFSATPDNPLQANEPAIVLRFGTNINFAQNFFVNADTGQAIPLGAGDSSYDTTAFATKIRSVGIWFSDYNSLVGGGMSNTPRVYLFPTGRDLMRSPTANRGTVRAFDVLDQAIPAPFPLGGASLADPNWTPVTDTLSEGFINLRRYPSFRAYHTLGGLDTGEPNTNELSYDSRLIGRSVWNTEWYLIIPGGTLHSNRDEGIRRFIWGRLGRANDGSFVLDDQGQERDGNGVSDIRLFFQTYAYTGNNR